MDSGRASTLELLRGLPTRREVLRPSEPHLSLYSTRTKLGSTLESKLTLSARRSRGVKLVLWVKVGLGGPLVRPASHLGWPGSQVSWPHWLSHLRSSSWKARQGTLLQTCVFASSVICGLHSTFYRIYAAKYWCTIFHAWVDPLWMP
jgi:hypothetical protein